MAKVTLILEDTEEVDGKPGLMIDWQSDNDYEEGSLAHEYAAAFVQGVMNNANKAEIIDKDSVAIQPKGEHEEDPGFN